MKLMNLLISTNFIYFLLPHYYAIAEPSSSNSNYLSSLYITEIIRLTKILEQLT